MKRQRARTLLWLLPLPGLVAMTFTGLCLRYFVPTAEPGLSALIATVAAVFSFGFSFWVQLGVLGLFGYVTQRYLRMPAEWYTNERMLVYLFRRRPRYQAAVAASYPFMRPHPLPKVPSDLTWPLSRETDNGLAEMMRSLYKRRRQERGDMHAAVYAEVMCIDRACVEHGYHHADAAAVVMKLGPDQGLEAICSRIPAELATALA